LELQAQAIYHQLFDECNCFCKLGSVIETTSGGTPSRKKEEYYANGTVPWVKSKELNRSYIVDTEEKITELALNSSSAKIIPKHSILIAMYGATVGEYGIINKKMACNQAICALFPNNCYPYTFLFMFAKMNKQTLINLAIGSAQQNINQILIKQLDICSDVTKIKRFHEIVSPLFDRIEALIIENQRLTALRDTLLPKLMNGEIDVSNVEV
jgi:type I restriction enzyme S subunit